MVSFGRLHNIQQTSRQGIEFCKNFLFYFIADIGEYFNAITEKLLDYVFHRRIFSMRLPWAQLSDLSHYLRVTDYR